MGAVVSALLGATVAAQPGREPRQSLGVFGEWGAFRQGPNCYAIAEALPDPRRREQVPYMTLSTGGRDGAVYVRLSRAGRAGSTARLRIGSVAVPLKGSGADQWVADRKGEAQVFAALRTATRLSVQAVDSRGIAFSDRYALDGAATAFDAARLACGRAR